MAILLFLVHHLQPIRPGIEMNGIPILSKLWWSMWHIIDFTIDDAANVACDFLLDERIVPKHVEQDANSDSTANHFDGACEVDPFVI